MKALIAILLLCPMLAAQQRIHRSTEPQPEAKLNDGVMPTYKTVPVTQDIPTCPNGMVLKHFVPEESTTVDTSGYIAVPTPIFSGNHKAHWEDVPAPDANVHNKNYRCFPPKGAAGVKSPMYDAFPSLAAQYGRPCYDTGLYNAKTGLCETSFIFSQPENPNWKCSPMTKDIKGHWTTNCTWKADQATKKAAQGAHLMYNNQLPGTTATFVFDNAVSDLELLANPKDSTISTGPIYVGDWPVESGDPIGPGWTCTKIPHPTDGITKHCAWRDPRKAK